MPEAANREMNAGYMEREDGSDWWVSL